jgi:transposase, IS5 family
VEEAPNLIHLQPDENAMRKVIEPQMQLGEEAIGAIRLDPKSRDDIPQLLRGLQHLYITPEVRERVFAILEEILPESKGVKADPNTGRPGMSQWTILVLGVLRLGLNADYDRIQELANQHSTLRQMLGHSDWADETTYELQTLKDNLRLFTPETLDRINQEVVRAGHQALKKSPEDGVVGRCDSFVVETDVHFPTDINLLLDAIRKTIETCVKLSEENNLSGWRAHAYHQRQFKKQYRKVQRLKHSSSRDEDKRQRKQAEIQAAHRVYLELAQSHLARAEQTRQQVDPRDPMAFILRQELDSYLAHARRQIEQIDRRVLQGERIPHEEKVFSIFEPHTEWICKGKAGVPMELGLRVSVVEDKDRFILHHQVMEKTTDDQVAIALVDETQQRFPQLRAISMDKGFHSPANQAALKERLDCVVLPKKGRRSQADKARESEAEFRQLRKEHSAVESAINALEQHGLDQCPDHGIKGFKRYVGLAVVARNIQRLGAILRQQEQEKEERKRGPYQKKAA